MHKLTKEQRTLISQDIRDRRNANIALRQRMDADDAHLAAIDESFAMIDEVERTKGGLEADVARLTQERDSLTHTVKALRAETQSVKTLWQAETVKLEAVRQDLAGLKSRVEAHIEGGENARKVLAELGSH